MSVKVEIESKSYDATDFPQIMISSDNGVIVFFTKHGKGFQLMYKPGSLYPHWSDHWSMTGFKPFNGVVRLSNDVST